MRFCLILAPFKLKHGGLNWGEDQKLQDCSFRRPVPQHEPDPQLLPELSGWGHDRGPPLWQTGLCWFFFRRWNIFCGSEMFTNYPVKDRVYICVVYKNLFMTVLFYNHVFMSGASWTSEPSFKFLSWKF